MNVIKKYIRVVFVSVGVLVFASDVCATSFTKKFENAITEKINRLPVVHDRQAVTDGEETEMRILPVDRVHILPEMRMLPIMDEEGNVISDTDDSDSHNVTIDGPTSFEDYEVES